MHRRKSKYYECPYDFQQHFGVEKPFMQLPLILKKTKQNESRCDEQNAVSSTKWQFLWKTNSQFCTRFFMLQIWSKGQWMALASVEGRPASTDAKQLGLSD